MIKTNLFLSLQSLEREKFDTPEHLFIPSFKLKIEHKKVPEIEGLVLSKNEENESKILNVNQQIELEFFTAPESEGTPAISPNPDQYPTEIIEDDFIIVVTHNSFEESLEMPLIMAHIDRTPHWQIVR